MKKERIKDQMVRTAARLWNVPENEIDTSFDPLILLMLDACAAELEKIGYDISASHGRLLDKLAGLILPEAMMGPKPASCVVHAKPVEPTAVVHTQTGFFTTQRVNTQNGLQNLDMFLAPAGAFTLHKADLSYLQAGGRFYRIHPGGQRDLLHGRDHDTMSLVQDIWLVLSPDKDLQSLKGLSLYFDLRSHSEAPLFYKSLDTAAAFIGDTPIALKSGYYDHEQFEPNLQEMMVSGDDLSKKIARHTAGIYQSQFLHIADEAPVAQLIQKEVPQALQQQLPQAVVQQLAGQPMIYLRLALGRVFHQEVLNAMQCNINAFPAINRKANVLHHRSDPWINIVPVQAEGHFLDLHAITSITGGGYKFRVSSDAHGMEAGEAMVRTTGVGKANSREVREIIGSLMEAIRDESAYFSAINNEFIQARLKEINQILARLEDQVDRSRDHQSGYQYILLRSRNPGEQLVIHFWTTNGADANGIKAGTTLLPFNHTLVAAKDAYTITNAVGGRSGVTETEKKNLLRQQLLSRGRIVSADDIKMCCAQFFGSKLKNATVQKGVHIGAGKAEGFVRTIDVQLTLSEEGRNASPDEITYLCRELEYTLQANGAPVYPFRVLLQP